MKRNPITEYLSRIGRKGGKVRSAAKVAAARENGKKGGRPRKRPGKGVVHATKATR